MFNYTTCITISTLYIWMCTLYTLYIHFLHYHTNAYWSIPLHEVPSQGQSVHCVSSTCVTEALLGEKCGCLWGLSCEMLAQVESLAFPWSRSAWHFEEHSRGLSLSLYNNRTMKQMQLRDPQQTKERAAASSLQKYSLLMWNFHLWLGTHQAQSHFSAVLMGDGCSAESCEEKPHPAGVKKGR